MHERMTESDQLFTIEDAPAVPAPSAPTALPEHLVWLPGGQWALWRWVGLRGTGFPVELVFQLAAPACGAAADQLLRAEDEAQSARSKALEHLQHDLAAAARGEREALERVLRQIKKGQLPEPLYGTGATATAINAVRATTSNVDQARNEFRQQFDAATVQISAALRDVASSDRFREAVTWQNRQAVHTGIDALLRNGAGAASRGSKQRQHEELVASYVQRYSVKNDTIGFFGPVGWAHISPHEGALSARPGSDLLAARTVYFDGWCIDALAEALATDEALLPWLAPRRMPFIYLDGTTLFMPFKGPSQVSIQESAVLSACDGERTARNIAMDLIQNSASGLASEAEIYDLLKQLREVRKIAWTLEAPFESYPERNVREAIERVGDAQLRATVSNALLELETARDSVARAAGSAKRLDRALGELETTFTRLTNVAATRSAGKTYAGRTLVYEDCRRDIEVSIGSDVLDALGPPLTLVMQSARWFTFTVAPMYRQIFKQMYAGLAQRSGSSIIDFAGFLMALKPPKIGDHIPPPETLLPTFQDHWAKILDLPPGQRRVAYTSAELGPRVHTTFAAPRPGWKYALHNSPDILLAASSIDAINRGDYQFVMGEFHIGLNSLSAGLFVQQHPSPKELFQAYDRDLPDPRVAIVIPRNLIPVRLRPSLTSAKDFRLTFSPDACGIPRSQELPVGELVMEDSDEGVVVRTRDGRLRFDIIDVLAEVLSMIGIHSFKLLRPSTHTPRVTIDRLVICRETWNFAATELVFAQEKDSAERFVAARRWAHSHDMPRFVFVKASVERKPFYVDFDSPIYIDILAKTIRRTIEASPEGGQITLTEMLPDAYQTWLRDAEDRHYTSELRMVSVDLGG